MSDKFVIVFDSYKLKLSIKDLVDIAALNYLPIDLCYFTNDFDLDSDTRTTILVFECLLGKPFQIPNRLKYLRKSFISCYNESFRNNKLDSWDVPIAD